MEIRIAVIVDEWGNWRASGIGFVGDNERDDEQRCSNQMKYLQKCGITHEGLQTRRYWVDVDIDLPGAVDVVEGKVCGHE